jgi:hypothetical protein
MVLRALVEASYVSEIRNEPPSWASSSWTTEVMPADVSNDPSRAHARSLRPPVSIEPPEGGAPGHVVATHTGDMPPQLADVTALIVLALVADARRPRDPSGAKRPASRRDPNRRQAATRAGWAEPVDRHLSGSSCAYSAPMQDGDAARGSASLGFGDERGRAVGPSGDLLVATSRAAARNGATRRSYRNLI